jgi:hypothetical protein
MRAQRLPEELNMNKGRRQTCAVWPTKLCVNGNTVLNLNLRSVKMKMVAFSVV